MSKLLEIFGKAINVNVADLIWNWLDCVKDKRIQPQFTAEFEEILELLSQLKLVEAEQKLRFYLFENPQCTCGRMAAAAICLHNNQLKLAIDELTSVYCREPANTLALYALGNCYERMGQEAQAAEFYQDALKFKNYLELPRKRLAAIYYKTGQTDRVIKEYEQLLQETPDDISSLVCLGNLYLVTQKYETAIEKFNRAILIHPDNFQGDDEQEIEMYIQQGDHMPAIDILRYQIDQEPERGSLYLKLADIEALEGNDEEALCHYKQAVRLEPQCLEANIKLGTFCMKSGYLAEASRCFARAMDLNDEIIDAYLGLATSQRLAGKAKDAYETVSLAGAIAPNSILLFAQMATIQFKIANESKSDFEACEHPSETFKIEPAKILAAHAQIINAETDNADAYYRYAMLLMSINNMPAAAKNFETALTINPTFHRARTKLAVCRYELGQKKESIDTLLNAVVPDKAMMALYYKTAILYTDPARFESAARNVEQMMVENFAHGATAPAITIVLQNLGLVDRGSAMLECLAKTAGKAE